MSIDLGLLDNPIWTSLQTSHARFAQTSGSAARFSPEVSVLAGVRGGLREGLDALASLVEEAENIGLFLKETPVAAPGWSLEREGPLLQMVHGGGDVGAPAGDFVRLGSADAPQMRELALLTKPGPFGPRTHELGVFWGVRVDGKLVAMTGERLRLPGFTEISAVCTHPDHLGRGYASALLAVVARQIRARGETPFLHVLPGNNRAVGVYERLGFSKRLLLRYAIFRRS